MRWDNLRDARQPPALFEQGAVTRTFDTPGFRGMTFFEVHARSIINRVPDASRVPFRWTINPYRGCSHACVYCTAGETPILMADGRTRPIASLTVGDAVYGTIRRGPHRRYVLTPVLAHWQTVKPAYLITLADGTHLIASGDHRFLSSHGWRYVTGGEDGASRRPHLATGTRLMGVGAFAHPPRESAEYRLGYLCGLIRGNTHPRRGASGDVHRLRLAPAGPEALDRARGYLAGLGIGTPEVRVAPVAAMRRQVPRSWRDQVCLPGWLGQWPSAPGDGWRKGFLAGIFDAAGSHSQGVLRIADTGPGVLQWVSVCMNSLGLRTAVDRAGAGSGLPQLRVQGDLRDRLRFFHATDPAITRLGPIEGAVVKSGPGLSVTRVEPVAAGLPMYDITTGTGDFIANGVVSHNCFARNTHTYLDLDAGHDFNSRIVVKVNAPELVRRELAGRRWRGGHIAMGTNVDCYQRAEGRYRLMPGILAALRDAANPFSILTKGTLILRDADLLAEAAEVTEVGLAVSVGSIDEDLWRAIEPGTPSPLRRLDVCAALAGSGLGCGVLMGPVVPFLSDSPAQLAATVRQIAAAGAGYVTPIVLHLRPGAREWFLAWLREHHPGLAGRYRALYGRGSYAPRGYQERIAGQVQELAREYGIGRGGHRRVRQPGRPAARPEPVQLPLL